MKRTFLLIFFVVAAAMCVQAHEMDVTRSGGLTNQLNLADIRAITFALHGSTAVSALREDVQSGNSVMLIHTLAGTFHFPVAAIDSVRFFYNARMAVYPTGADSSTFALVDIDSVTFAPTVVSVAYSGASATVDNPLAGAGVAVAVTGADVIVTSTAGLDGIRYVLTGTTTNGMFKVYSDRDFTLQLNGVQITNSDGPAINIQADVEIAVEVTAGTTNTLTDGATYATAPNGEDQKSAFFSEGQVIFSGTGSLVVHGYGKSQNGLGSDDYIVVEDGSITVQSAVKDGIHTNEGYFQHGGTVNVTSTSDGVDAGDGPVEITAGSLTVLNTALNKDAVKCGSSIQISGGDIHLTVQGNQSKGLNAATVRLTGGTVNIGTSGGVVLVPTGLGYDPSYCTAVKADSQVVLDGCGLTITATGSAGRGISSDGTVRIQSGSLSVTSSGGGGTYYNELGVLDAYHGPCLRADGDVTLSGGTVTLSHSGPGGRGITTNSDLSIGTTESSPTLSITTTGASIPLGGVEYYEAKTIKADSTITIDNGNLTISSADDAIKSEYRLEVNGGLINITTSYEGLESANIIINGGEIHVTATNDGLNATYGLDIQTDDGSNLTISGGYVDVTAPSGDGIDSNGDLTISGGTVIVHGPPAWPEMGLDVNGTFLANGGFLVVAQITADLNDGPSYSSTQRSVMLRRTETYPAGMLFHVEDTSGNSLVTFMPTNTYSCVLISSADLISGRTYRVYSGGTCTGTLKDGLYTGGTYSGGTLRTTFTSSGVAQVVNY